jgi:hypothetical protein
MNVRIFTSLIGDLFYPDTARDHLFQFRGIKILTPTKYPFDLYFVQVIFHSFQHSVKCNFGGVGNKGEDGDFSGHGRCGSAPVRSGYTPKAILSR